MDKNKLEIKKKKEGNNKKKTKMSLFGNKYVNIKNGILYLGNHKVKDLPNFFQTPIFLFLGPKIIANMRKIRQAFSKVFPNSRGFYSLKANYLSPLITYSKENNFGLELVGEIEFKMALAQGFPLENVLAGGPYLPKHFLERLLIYNVGFIVIYSIDSLIMLGKLLEKNFKNDGKKKQKILLRFTSPKFTSRHGIRLNEENINEIIKILKKYPKIELYGFLSHFGTRLKTTEHYLKNLEILIKITKFFKKYSSEFQPKVFNIGGGFPRADELSKSSLINHLKSIKDRLYKEDLENIEIFYEPGRYIVSDTGFCLTKIYRYDKQTKTAFLDVGNNFIPKFMKADLRFYNVNKIYESPNYSIDFMGPIPSDQDILAKNYNFTPSVERGDYVLIANVGAYALTWSTRFPYPKPKLLLLGESDYEEINWPNLNFEE